MKRWEFSKADAFIISGIILVMAAPYLPNFFFEGLLMDAYNHGAIRYEQVIPSIRLGGILFFAWGIAFLIKDKKK